VEHTVPAGQEVVCPPEVVQAAPLTMPLCRDEEECEELPMPQEETQALPRPQEESAVDVDTMLQKRLDGEGCPCKAKKPCKKTGTDEHSKRAPHKVRFFKEREPIDETCPIHTEVDTMEYRASDGQLYDYGRPGVL
jgi:hypothetical protein